MGDQKILAMRLVCGEESGEGGGGGGEHRGWERE
jgi:hypothetical protein